MRIAGASDLASGNAVFTAPGTFADLHNCTIVHSGLGMGSGAIRCLGTVKLHNCIMWSNQDGFGSGQAAQFVGTPAEIQYCTIQGWTGSLGGVGNNGIVPGFVNLLGVDGIAGNDDDNTRLAAGSACIDAAANVWLVGVTTDLDRLPRFRDDPVTPDSGTGTAPTR